MWSDIICVLLVACWTNPSSITPLPTLSSGRLLSSVSPLLFLSWYLTSEVVDFYFLKVLGSSIRTHNSACDPFIFLFFRHITSPHLRILTHAHVSKLVFSISSALIPYFQLKFIYSIFLNQQLYHSIEQHFSFKNLFFLIAVR